MLTHEIEERFEQLQQWLAAHLAMPVQRVSRLAGDASSRQYYRVYCRDRCYIAMDALSDRDSCTAFIAIANAFRGLGLNVPIIYAQDIQQGFLLMTDFGDRLYCDVLTVDTCHELYQQAFRDLLMIQSCSDVKGYALPFFTHTHYFNEMALFHDWYLSQYLRITLSKTQYHQLQQLYTLLAEMALSQPLVCVHRDYHSRNLMVVDSTSSPGILDFQGAVWGPITYDIVSLVRDCYIHWPPSQVEGWIRQFHQQALQADLLEEEDPQLFLQWTDWMGLQRHMKCIGLFARLQLRDNKSAYLQYIPRVIQYAREVCERYSPLTEFTSFFR
ncbi:MAG: phosphotransferase [Coxiella sp. RIFCSPHIGHO2_12_FULL_44_14]|nr:MAG: phosphotransferase [Coxiella sp. RIFCSPHIGHO2_12_FULL_44_14]